MIWLSCVGPDTVNFTNVQICTFFAALEREKTTETLFLPECFVLLVDQSVARFRINTDVVFIKNPFSDVPALYGSTLCFFYVHVRKA